MVHWLNEENQWGFPMKNHLEWIAVRLRLETGRNKLQVLSDMNQLLGTLQSGFTVWTLCWWIQTKRRKKTTTLCIIRWLSCSKAYKKNHLLPRLSQISQRSHTRTLRSRCNPGSIVNSHQGLCRDANRTAAWIYSILALMRRQWCVETRGFCRGGCSLYQHLPCHTIGDKSGKGAMHLH